MSIITRPATITREQLDAALKAGALKQGPVFYRVTIETIVPDTAAIQRQAGLKQMLGGSALIASALSPERSYGQVVDSAIHYVGLTDAHTLPILALLER